MKREQLYILGDGDAAAYYKSEADSVMDAYEARIKELELVVIGYKASLEWANLKMCEKDARIKELGSMLKDKDEAMDSCRGLIESANVMSKDAKDKLLNRIKELEYKNERLKAANFDLQSHFATLKEDYDELKVQVPKWISVKDRLPEDGEYILFVFKNCMFFGYYNKDCEFHWCYHTGAVNGATHWMSLPPPPTTEEPSATEKES